MTDRDATPAQAVPENSGSAGKLTPAQERQRLRMTDGAAAMAKALAEAVAAASQDNNA